eukprot:12213257-Alexandrium_andersonii.AAC.1
MSEEVQLAAAAGSESLQRCLGEVEVFYRHWQLRDTIKGVIRMDKHMPPSRWVYVLCDWEESIVIHKFGAPPEPLAPTPTCSRHSR